MANYEPLLTDCEGGLSRLSINEPLGPVTTTSTTTTSTSSSSAMARNGIPQTLPQDILDLIFASLCPPPPSEWVHGTRTETRTAIDGKKQPRAPAPPSQPPDIIWPVDSKGNGDEYPVNALLLGDINRNGAQNPSYVEYKLATRTLANVARTSSWARELVERYLYRYVVLVRGRQLAGFVATVEGRFHVGFGLAGSTSQEESEANGRGGSGYLRLGKYVWGVYCFVDMMREEDLAEWYRFEMQLEEWDRNRKTLGSLQSDSVPVGEVEGQEGKGGEEGKKKKKKKRKGKGKGKEKADGISGNMPVSRNEGDRKEEDTQTTPPPPTPDYTTRPQNHIAAPGVLSTKSAKASSSSARRNRRKKAQNTDHLIKPLDEMGTFFRLHSAMLHRDMYEHSSEGMSLSPRNLYNLLLRLFLSPSGGTLLPNLTDLLCSWYIIERVSGIVKEPDYLSFWIPGRVTLHPRPSALHKINTFTIRPPVKHPTDNQNTPFTAFRDVQPTLGGILDALPNLETFDTVFLSACRSWGAWLYRPLLEAGETAAERELRLANLREGISGSRIHPLKHMRVYGTSSSPANIAAFVQNLAPGSLETLLVRFRHLSPASLGDTPGTILLGHNALVDNGVKESLRYLELVSTPSRHFLTRTMEMQSNPRLRRLTCLPYLTRLEELVVDFQGLFGDIGKAGGLKEEEDMDLLRRDACLPPNLETLKVLCVWSSGADEWFYISPPVGEYVISGQDVAMFVEGFSKAHREGLLRCCKTLRRLVLVVPERLKRVSAVDGGLEGIERARAREGVVVEEAGRYFEAKGVEFVVERGMDVLDSARGT